MSGSVFRTSSITSSTARLLLPALSIKARKAVASWGTGAGARRKGRTTARLTRAKIPLPSARPKFRRTRNITVVAASMARYCRRKWLLSSAPQAIHFERRPGAAWRLMKPANVARHRAAAARVRSPQMISRQLRLRIRIVRRPAVRIEAAKACNNSRSGISS